MEAAAAFANPWLTTESQTLTVEETKPWYTLALRDPSPFIEAKEPLKQLLDFLKPSTSVFRVVESLTRWLVEEGVRLHDVGRIQDYIVEFPDLIEVIPQAVKAAKKHLPEAQLILEVYHDPEIDDRCLVLYVRLPMYDEKVMERIEAAEAEFLDRLADAEGWLLLTTDFGKPEAG